MAVRCTKFALALAVTANGWVTIENNPGGSGKCLTVKDNKCDNGTPIVLYHCGGWTNQAWEFDGKQIKLMPWMCKGKCLDVFNGCKNEDECKVELWDCNGADEQEFGGIQDNGNSITTSAEKCLDITAGDTSDNTPIKTYHCSSSLNQRWSAPHHGDALNATVVV